ncbi:MAG: methyltransferase domain-containing protein [Methanocalculus sp.]|uniref:class I SAM-dependent methyltransferase n=1 Tax=Methanocalculus sp. TaxID=2004547 RepID=UPI002718B9ED|nr:class I SAM-dependent methyltransferase [Methanocalculus sp.]MDO9539348.1 methyltransferase domain-containing protein [Methanocalculus sp.]
MNARKDENSGPRAVLPEILIRELIIKLALKGNERVLHIGSGDGIVTAAIAACLPRGSVLGVDASGDQIRTEKVTSLPNRYNNIQFSDADFDHLTFENEFDVVFSHNLVSEASLSDTLYKGIHRLLTPGGRLLLQMEGKGSSDHIISKVNALLSLEPWKEYCTGYRFSPLPTEDEVMELCDEAYLYTIRVDLFPRTILFSGDASFETWIRNVWHSLLAKVPKDQSDRLVTAITQEYHTLYPPASDGSVTLPVSRLEIEARKESDPDTP